MKIYHYKNCTVYISEPTEEHIKRIKKATTVFLKRVIKEKNQNETRGYRRRVSIGNSNTRERN